MCSLKRRGAGVGGSLLLIPYGCSHSPLWAVILCTLPSRCPFTSPGFSVTIQARPPTWMRFWHPSLGCCRHRILLSCLALALTHGTGLHGCPVHPAWAPWALVSMLGWLYFVAIWKCYWLEWDGTPFLVAWFSTGHTHVSGMCCVPQITRVTYRLITNRLDVLEMAFQLWYAIEWLFCLSFCNICICLSDRIDFFHGSRKSAPVKLFSL